MTKQSAEIAGTRDAKDTTSFVSAMFIGANMTRRRGSWSNVHGTGVVMGGGSTMSRFTLTLSEKKIDWLIYYSPKIVPGSARYHARRWHLYAFHNSKIHVHYRVRSEATPYIYMCMHVTVPPWSASFEMNVDGFLQVEKGSLSCLLNSHAVP